jgi:formylglycine-generating enzyme required for sulfatase activity
MKNAFLLIATILLSSSFVMSQLPKADFEIWNCEPITGDYLFAAKTELSNFQYLEFLSHQQKKLSNEEYLKLLPDSTKWRQKDYSNEAYVNVYFRHPAYRDYPCVNITKQQAEAYCVWLTSILNQNFQEIEENEKHPVKEVIVRLPTEKEWEKAARAGNEHAIFPWKGTSMRSSDKKHKGTFRAAFVRGRGDYMGIAGQLNDNSDVTAPIKTYAPNSYGLYNMSGNVSEMVSDKNTTKGGGWKSLSMNLEIDTSEVFDGTPRSDVGFRYFVEVVSLKEQTKKQTSLEKLLKDLLVYIPSATHETRDTTVSVQAFYMSKTEVTNELYNYFVAEHNDHASNGKFWSGVVPYAKRLENDYATNSKFGKMPVVNIEKVSMEAFCNWLSEKYDSNEKFKGLQFRLPLEIEWELAAGGGQHLPVYPWGGMYIRNSKGCHLANHSSMPNRWIHRTGTSFVKSGVTKDQVYSVSNLDGAYIPADVTSYNPNNFGLFNMAGNVSELVSDKEITKGGSWGSFEHQLQINSSEKFEGASPFVGFRVVGSYLGK